MTRDDAPPALIAGDLTHKVIGVFFDVYNELGPGFPEHVPRKALGIALDEAGVPFHEEAILPVWFRGRRIATFRADLVVDGRLIVEVKVSRDLEAIHTAQVLHYLKATDMEVGLVVNFGRRPAFSRVVYENARKCRPIEHPSSYDPPRLAGYDVGTPRDEGIK